VTRIKPVLLAFQIRANTGLRWLLHWGRARHCPVCATSTRGFAEFGVVARPDARCIICDSLERHRLAWLYFTRKTDLFDGRPKQVLHVSPEPCFERKLQRAFGPGYLTADLLDPRAMVKMDVSDIPYPNEMFDVILCSHVLQYVPDDKRAMRELYRVLKPGGWAMLLVPTAPGRTEEPAGTAATARADAFDATWETQARHYGQDYAERLRDCGFDVSINRASDLESPEEITRMGLADAGEIFCCTK
jgi:Methyltransferase domain